MLRYFYRQALRRLWPLSKAMVCAIILPAWPALVSAQTPDQNVILVKFTETAFAQLNLHSEDGIVLTGIPSLDALGQELRLKSAARVFRAAARHEDRHGQFGLNRYFKFTFDRVLDLESILARYQADANLEVVQLNRKYDFIGNRPKPNRLNFTPNDPSFPSQWHYHNTGQTGGTPDADIDAPEAWDIETGDPSVIVSDLDTGQDLDHPDLAANIWVNPGEIAGNGMDDDGNGYIDDVKGWDFSDDDNNPDDYDSHGTHTAGTVAAVTNNGEGVAGVAFNAKVMPCKIFPNAFDNVIAEAFTYAADNGSIVSTNSWSYSLPGPPSPIMEDAIDYFLATSNGVVVFAAGNNNTTDPTWGYPASYPPVIAVAATNHTDTKASFSNYGSWVDVSAPGVNVLSTVIGGYASYNGTSMACPHVAGIAALVFAANPGFSGAQVRAQIEGGTDNIDAVNPGFAGLLGTGRANAYKALVGGPFPNPPTDLQASVSGNEVQLSWDDPTTNTNGTPINLAHLNVYRNGSKIAEVNGGVESYTDAGVPDGAYNYHVTATNVEGFESSASNVVNLIVGTIDVAIWLPSGVIDPNLAEKARARGLTVAEVEAMVAEPQSHLAIQAALAVHGKSSAVFSDITALDLSQFQAVFAVLGIYPNNHVVPANSPEALALQNYVQSGGKVYLEGGDVWYYDPAFAGGHDFGPLFGLDGLSDGTNDLNTVLGVSGTFTAGMNFTYSGQNNYIDHLAPLPGAFNIHQNSSPSYNCGVAYDPGPYFTIGTAYEFGGLNDASASSATKADLMLKYLQFLEVPVAAAEAVIWIPSDVLEPNLAEKAAQRGFSLQQVQDLRVHITSHEELAAALEANDVTTQVVSDLAAINLADSKYLFVVLGIYPNNHVIKSTDVERQIIEEFLADSGRVYIEGGDVWYYDPLNLGGHDFGPAFGIVAQADGINDLKTIYGSCAVEELDFVYKGVNNFIDHIAAAAQACLFHSNFAPVYGCGVGYDPQTGARTIGNTFQFGGLDDHSLSAATKTELMAKYLEFFDSGMLECQISVVSPNGGESAVAGETFPIQWTSLYTSGQVKLEFSTDDGANYTLIAAGETDDGFYNWSVPNTLSNNCRVRISDNAEPGCFDVSDGVFAIVPDPDWLVPITVEAVSTLSDELPEITAFNLAFGGHPNATDGYDPGLDVIGAPPGFNYYAYFLIDPPVSFLNTDIRGWLPPFEADIDWALVVTNAQGITSEVTWDNTKFPAPGTFTLKGPNLNVDMRAQNSVQFVSNTPQTTLTIEYRFEACALFEFPVAGGAWYLVSLPVVPENNAVSALFPGAAAAFGWNYESQSYLQASALEPGTAYWLLMLQTAAVEVCGQPFASYTRNYTNPGWDLTGGVVATSPLVDTPDGNVAAMFRWDAITGQYISVTPQVAEPKQGYWILVIAAPTSISVGGSSLLPLAGDMPSADLSAVYRKYGAMPPPPPYAFNKEEAETRPVHYGLSQNFPNPFNPETRIDYQLPQAGTVTLKVYNLLGQPIRTLAEGEKEAGYYKVIWDGKDYMGRVLPAGVYLYRMESGAFTQTRKVILLK